MTGERDLRDEPVEHRTGNTDPAGKRTVRKEFHVTEELDQDITAVARVKGIPTSEYIRRCVERDIYGELELMRRSVRRDES